MPCPASFFNAGAGSVFGRVQKGDVADQGQVRFIGDRIRRLVRRQVFDGHCHHPQTFSPQRRGYCLRLGQQGSVQRLRGHGSITVQTGIHRVGQAHVRAGRQHLFHRAFANEFVLALLAVHQVGHHHRHTTPFKVKRNLIDLVVRLLELELGSQLHMVQHRVVQQVFQAGLVETVEKGKVQHLVGVLPKSVGVARQRDLVLRQRAGFVGAEDVHGAKVLDRIEPLDHHFFTRQQHRAFGQRAGDDHRQHLGRQPYRHR